MPYLEYYYCLITIIIISIIVIVFIILYYHFNITIMIIIIIIVVVINDLSPSKLNELHYPKYHLEFNSGNKIVFTFTFRKLFSILTQTVMSTSKLR